jgi:hypothetical protein
MSPVKTAEKQGSRFQKCRSGNPKGSRNSATLAAEFLLDGEASLDAKGHRNRLRWRHSRPQALPRKILPTAQRPFPELRPEAARLRLCRRNSRLPKLPGAALPARLRQPILVQLRDTRTDGHDVHFDRFQLIDSDFA